MKKTRGMVSKIVSMLAAVVIGVTTLSVSAYAKEDLEVGTYTVDANLSCFVNAMGGIEFGAPLLTKTVVEVNEDGSANVNLSFTKGHVNIYGVDAYTFIDPNYQLGFKNGSSWEDVSSYTLSNDSCPNPTGDQINYVDSMTFTVPTIQDSYDLAVYINSQVMGVQFGGEAARYNSKLSVNWDTAKKVKEANESTKQSATVNYNITGGYEVNIPATITADNATKVGNYNIEAENFVLFDNAYVSVVADTTGTLTNGKDSLSFTNTLDGDTLKKTGDVLRGTVTITDSAKAPGNYAGTIDFTINYYAE